VTLNVGVNDDAAVERVIMLYRPLTITQWTKVELTYDPMSGYASATLNGLTGPLEYFAQAVDSTGNVALALEHGNPFYFDPASTQTLLYLPLVRR